MTGQTRWSCPTLATKPSCAGFQGHSRSLVRSPKLPDHPCVLFPCTYSCTDRSKQHTGTMHNAGWEQCLAQDLQPGSHQLCTALAGSLPAVNQTATSCAHACSFAGNQTADTQSSVTWLKLQSCCVLMISLDVVAPSATSSPVERAKRVSAGTGYAVLHCHILPHEDEGCMLKTQILNKV